MLASDALDVGPLSTSIAHSTTRSVSAASDVELEEAMEGAADFFDLNIYWDEKPVSSDVGDGNGSLVKRAKLREYSILPKGEVRIYRDGDPGAEEASYRLEYVRGSFTDLTNRSTEMGCYLLDVKRKFEG